MRAVTSCLIPSLALLLAATAGSAWAEDNDSTPVHSLIHRDIVVEVDESVATILTPEQFALAGSNILFVNPCRGGETIYRGYNDSRNNTSSIVPSTTTFPEYPHGDESWAQVMEAVRDMLAPYGIVVTDQDPGGVGHFEIITCGTSFRGENVLGVAPSGCGIVDNAIGYAFAEEHGNQPRYIAETIVHEAGHTWSLPHLYDCADPMTYLNGCGNKYFQDTTLECAELDGNDWVKRSCSCGRNGVNSHQTVLSAFGPSEPTPPQVSIEEPLNGQTVAPGFVVRPQLTDDQGIHEASLYIDGALVLTLTQGPYVFNAPGDIAKGDHTVEVRAADRLGAQGTATVNVIVGDLPPGDTGGNPGDLGQPCNGGGDCTSGMCARDGEAGLCTQTCNDDCPGGFDCVEAGGSSVCWPVKESGGCTASENSSKGGLPLLLLGFAVAMVAIRRR